MFNHPLTDARRPSPSMATHVRHIVNNVTGAIVMVSRWIQLHCQREQLAELEDHQLADLGLSRTQVRNECAKWPWQA
ncbi:DUF1127 domain-containing protein [Mesorhizobium sp. M8A.F.Ca.ET.218.01.1.1]|uniref:DUF1127 domain-containing protein n=1 Tax=unclassified Mesorhizobium TaxID=325217 RepID=UPI0032AEEC12